MKRFLQTRFWPLVGVAALIIALLPVAAAQTTGSSVILQPRAGQTTLSREIKLEWVSPSTKMSGITAYRKINVQVRSTSNMELDNSHFTLYLNEEPVGQKSGETPLVVSRFEYVYRTTVELPELGRYSLRAEVDVAGQKQKTTTLIVESVDIPPPVSIIWVKPNVVEAGGGIVVQDKPDMELVAVIEAGGAAISKDDIIVSYNGRHLRAAEHPDATLTFSNGKYSFRDVVTLIDTKDVQTISLLVDAAESDIIKVQFVPYRKPNLYVLAVGTQTNLQYSVRDATDFAALFQGQDQGNTLYNEVAVETLSGPQASTQNIRRAINRLKTRMQTSEINPNDLVVLFLSTHGFLLDGEFRLQGDDYSTAEEYATSISYRTDVLDILEKMPCKKIVFMDACHSGGAFDGGSKGGYDIAGAIDEMNRKDKGLVVFASSSRNELSYEDKAWGNGAFTKAIVRGLKEGKADANGNRLITLRELYDYLRIEVPRMVKQVKNKAQNPSFRDDNRLADISIYVIK